MCGADACLCSISRLFVRIRNKYISGFTRRRPRSPCEASLSREQRHVAVDVFRADVLRKGGRAFCKVDALCTRIDPQKLVRTRDPNLGPGKPDGGAEDSRTFNEMHLGDCRISFRPP